MSFKASSLRKSQWLTGKLWNPTFLLVYLSKLSDYAQACWSMLLPSLLAVELEGPSQGEEPTDMRDLL